jgi:hypothetical protein
MHRDLDDPVDHFAHAVILPTSAELVEAGLSTGFGRIDPARPDLDLQTIGRFKQPIELLMHYGPVEQPRYRRARSSAS